ncbi:MAG: MraY family glycosyltransferase [Actinomycetota bacterium]
MSRLATDGLLFAGTALFAFLATPLARRLALRVGLVDHPADHKHHQVATPYLGGLAIAGAVLLALVGGLMFAPSLRGEVAAIAGGGFAVAAIGLIDDWRTIGPLPRLLVQAAAGVGLWIVGIRLGPTGVVAIDLAATIFVVLAVTNAVNLLDNMDGLSAGTTAIASIFFFVVAYQQGQLLVSLMAALLAGACAGFLPHNFPPAKVFMGDAGTLFLGFLLSVSAIKLRIDGQPVVVRGAVPFLILSVPLFDMALVVLSRWRAKRPIFQGGTDHSSHRLLILGADPRRIALTTYGAAIATGLIALVLLQLGHEVLSWILVGVTIAMGAELLWIFESVYRGRIAIVPLQEPLPEHEQGGVLSSSPSDPSKAPPPGDEDGDDLDSA